MFNMKRLLVRTAPIVVSLLAASLASAQSTACYNLQSLQGSYAVVVNYGANVALGLQPETLDGAGNLTRTGINNQPTAGSTTGARTIANVTSTGTYTVNCNGTGTITRLVTRADGTTASAADDFVITEGIEKGGQLLATKIVDAQRDPSVIVPGGIFVTRTHMLRPESQAGCYTLDSLQGSFAVVVNYGANVAFGLQPEYLDGRGNLSRTGINNQPVAGSTTGERTIANVTSNGTYTVNCNGTGTITRVVTRADGSTASASDDFLITAGVAREGRIIATEIVDAQRDPSVIVPGGIFVTRTHTLRPNATSPLEGQLQILACGTTSEKPSCQVTVSVWNYYLINKVNPDAVALVLGDGTAMMTVQQYFLARATSGL